MYTHDIRLQHVFATCVVTLLATKYPGIFLSFKKLHKLLENREPDLPQQGSLLPVPNPLFPPGGCGQG